MEDQGQIRGSGHESQYSAPYRTEIVEILPVKADEEIEGQPVAFSGPQAIHGQGRIKASSLDREEEQTNRTILRQKVGLPLLFLNGAQIANHLELEMPQHLLVLCRQTGQMIGAKNQPPLHLAAITGPVTAEVTEIDSPGKW